MSPGEAEFEGEVIEEVETGAAREPFQWLISLTTLFLIASLVLIFWELSEFYGFLGGG